MVCLNSYYCLSFFFWVRTQTNSKTTEGKGKTNNRWNEVRWANMKFPSCQLAIPCIPGQKVVYLLTYKSLNSLHIFKLGKICGSFFSSSFPFLFVRYIILRTNVESHTLCPQKVELSSRILLPSLTFFLSNVNPRVIPAFLFESHLFW